MPTLQDLEKCGQSVWSDFLSRSMIKSGDLQKLIDIGLRGVTSNPTIFEKAFTGSADYDEDIQEMAHRDLSVEQIYDNLTLKDIEMAADLFMPAYENTHGLDGFVSIEVNPHLAYDTGKTVEEAKRIFFRLNRKNIMIKVPGTPEGLPAITALTAAGVNVNVTLLFDRSTYLLVIDAYLQGLEKLIEQGKEASRVISVASFFVSRVDTAVDKTLEEKNNHELLGKIAIANSRVVYEDFQNMIVSERWKRLQEQGARIQRVLWASTGTKNPSYPDTMYIDELIGPATISTMPPETLSKFLDHGTVALTLKLGLNKAKKQLAQLVDLGINLDEITHKLQEDGVKLFSNSYDSVMQKLQEKVDSIKKQKVLV